MNTQNEFTTSNELLTAILSANVGANAAGFKKDPDGFIAENYGIDLSHVEISIVDNTDDAVCLALPYYSVIEKHNAGMLDDAELEASGGDLFTLAAILIFGSVATVSATCIGVGMGVNFNK